MTNATTSATTNTSSANDRTAVLWCNLGSPDAPTAAAVRPYLADFLGDPRVVEIPKLLWALILHGIILRTRPAKSAAKYASIWMPEGSPLKVWTQKQATLLAGWLGERGHRVTVRDAMRYANPSIASRLDALQSDGATRVLVLQAYPQYSATTTASVIDAVNDWSRKQRRIPEFRFVNQYHDDPGYIDALAQGIERHWKTEGRGEVLLMSFHGIPARNIALGDPYQAQCLETARLLAARLGLSDAQHRVTFPVALRPRQVARALHRADAARARRKAASSASTWCARAFRPTASRRSKKSRWKAARPSCTRAARRSTTSPA
jgi:ferrochelatase